MAEDLARGRTGKLILAALLAVAGLGFVYHQWRSTHPTLAPPPPPAENEPMAGPPPGPGRGRGLFSDRDWAEMRERMATEIGLTEEQQRQLDALRQQGGEDFRSIREAFMAVLTPEQRERLAARREAFRQEIRARMRERLSRVLPPDQLEAFERKLEERRREGRGPFGGPMGPPPEGPPPDGPPPDGPPPDGPPPEGPGM